MEDTVLHWPIPSSIRHTMYLLKTICSVSAFKLPNELLRNCRQTDRHTRLVKRPKLITPQTYGRRKSFAVGVNNIGRCNIYYSIGLHWFLVLVTKILLVSHGSIWDGSLFTVSKARSTASHPYVLWHTLWTYVEPWRLSAIFIVSIGRIAVRVM